MIWLKRNERERTLPNLLLNTQTFEYRFEHNFHLQWRNIHDGFDWTNFKRNLVFVSKMETTVSELLPFKQREVLGKRNINRRSFNKCLQISSPKREIRILSLSQFTTKRTKTFTNFCLLQNRTTAVCRVLYYVNRCLSFRILFKWNDEIIEGLRRFANWNRHWTTRESI